LGARAAFGALRVFAPLREVLGCADATSGDSSALLRLISFVER